MSKDVAEEIVRLTERRLELTNQHIHAAEAEEFAARHRRMVQMSLAQVTEKLDRLIETRQIEPEDSEEIA